MGCESSKTSADLCGVNRTPGHNIKGFSTDCFSELTKDERALVIQTWAIVKDDSIMNGLQVFLRFFEKEPEAKKLFGIENVPLKEVPKNGKIQMHVPRFMGAINKAVMQLREDVNALGQFDDVLIDIGCRHKQYNAFEATYFDSFYESLMYQWGRSIGDDFTDATRNVWGRVFRRVMAKLKDGYGIEC